MQLPLALEDSEVDSVVATAIEEASEVVFVVVTVVGMAEEEESDTPAAEEVAMVVAHPTVMVHLLQMLLQVQVILVATVVFLDLVQA